MRIHNRRVLTPLAMPVTAGPRDPKLLLPRGTDMTPNRQAFYGHPKCALPGDQIAFVGLQRGTYLPTDDGLIFPHGVHDLRNNLEVDVLSPSIASLRHQFTDEILTRRNKRQRRPTSAVFFSPSPPPQLIPVRPQYGDPIAVAVHSAPTRERDLPAVSVLTHQVDGSC